MMPSIYIFVFTIKFLFNNNFLCLIEIARITFSKRQNKLNRHWTMLRQHRRRQEKQLKLPRIILL